MPFRIVSNAGGEGWLVGCFGFNGPLRQYFSLYRAVSQREGEREEKRIDESGGEGLKTFGFTEFHS